jgi:adenylate kinase
MLANLMIIIVTGIPGTGKTTIAKRLARELALRYIDGKRISKAISEGYDSKRRCEIIDTDKLNAKLIKIIEKDSNIIIDSHLSHYLPKRYVDMCIVTKCDLKQLETRLNKRKYSKQKIRDNLDAEIFDTCLTEAKEAKHKIMVVNTSSSYKIKEIAKDITKRTRR